MSTASHAHLYLSSQQSSQRTQGRFSINLGNNTHAEKTIGICPVQVTIPNIFENIRENEYRFAVEAANGGDISVHEYIIPAGQYSATEFLTTLTNILDSSNAGVTRTIGAGVGVADPLPDLSFSLVNNRITFTNASATISYAIGLTVETGDPMGTLDDRWLKLGYSRARDATNIAGASLLYFGYQVATSSATTADGLPDFGGERLVFIAADKLAHSNCTFGGDGSQYDIVACVPLTDTVFGGTKTYVTQDSSIHTIEYHYTNALGSTIEFQVLDSEFRPLDLPENFHVQMLLRIYHGDSERP